MQTTVTSTPTRLPTPGVGEYTLQNIDPSTTVYISRSANVTTTGLQGGMQLKPGGVFTAKTNTRQGDNYYAVVDAGLTAVVACETF